MKIVIGITLEPGKIDEYVQKYKGETESLTKVGPFVSRVEAMNWIVYLKSRIFNIKEIVPDSQFSSEDLWYGFTFEQGSTV